MFAIKFRKRGAKAWYFARSDGAGTRLKIHAARVETSEAAQGWIDRNAPSNPELEFKVVAL